MPSIAPSTRAQEHWFDVADSGRSNLSVVVTWRIEGELRRAALDAALQRLVDRHPTLRTSLARRDGTVVQLVEPTGFKAVEPVLMRADDLSAAEALIGEVADEAIAIDGLPGRALLIEVGDRGGWVLALVLLHLACDGWSENVLAHDLAELYLAAVQGRDPQLPALRRTFADHARWDRDFHDRAIEEHWRHALGRPREPVRFEGQCPWPQEETVLQLQPIATLSTELAGALKARARSARATLTMVLAAACADALRPVSGGRVTMPIVYPHRHDPTFRHVVGDFADLLPLPIDLRPTSFGALLNEVRAAWLTALTNVAPCWAITAASGRPARWTEHPSYDLSVNVLPSPKPPVRRAAAATAITAIEMAHQREFRVPTSPFGYPAEFKIAERTDGSMVVLLEQNGDLLAPATGPQLGERMLTTLTAFARG